MEGLVASRPTEPLPLPTQAKTRRAFQASRDIRSRAVKAESRSSRALVPVSVLAPNAPTCDRWVPGTRKPPPRVEIKQTVHFGVHEPKHDLGRQPRSPRNGQHICQQGAIVPTE